MTERQNEHLSALVDADMESADSHAESIDNLVRNESAQATWYRYQLIGAVMRNEAREGAPLDISAAVAAQVRQEPPMIAPRKTALQRFRNNAWLKPAANVAVAASVALVTVVGVMQYQRVDDGSIPAAAQTQGHQSVLQTMPMGGMVNPVSFSTVQPANPGLAQDTLSAGERAQQRAQFQAYMVDHQFQLQWNLQHLNEGANGESSTEASESESPTNLELPPQ